MAQVTIELRTLLGITNFEMFDFTYPITDSNWKAELERDIKNHYYFHEIGMETPDRFKQRLQSKMLEIMPYYDKLHQTMMMDFNPLVTHRRTETYEGSNQSSGNVDATDNTKSFEYPQNASPATDIASGMDDNKSTSQSIMSGAQDYERVVEGLDGNQSELIRTYRENILNLNLRIIEELRSLFILIY